MNRKELAEKFLEDNFSCGAGSPGMSSVGNISGNTNKGLRKLPDGFHEKMRSLINKQLSR